MLCCLSSSRIYARIGDIDTPKSRAALPYERVCPVVTRLLQSLTRGRSSLASDVHAGGGETGKPRGQASDYSCSIWLCFSVLASYLNVLRDGTRTLEKRSRDYFLIYFSSAFPI